MRLRPLITVSLSLLINQTHVRATAASEPTSVAIVELFTSEGCSSCPPADALLQQVNLKQSSEGQLIVGLSEHVTYWNNLGWKDPYSNQSFTDRQEVYAAKLSPEGPYTPQMVLNGLAQFVGSNGHALQDALHADALRKHAELRIMSVTQGSDDLNITFSLSGASSKHLEVVAVLTDDIDSSRVLRGENSGRSLQHVSVARSLTRIAEVNGDTMRSVRVSLPTGLLHEQGKAHHLVLFAQEPHQGAIVGASSKSL